MAGSVGGGGQRMGVQNNLGGKVRPKVAGWRGEGWCVLDRHRGA